MVEAIEGGCLSLTSSITATATGAVIMDKSTAAGNNFKNNDNSNVKGKGEEDVININCLLRIDGGSGILIEEEAKQDKITTATVTGGGNQAETETGNTIEEEEVRVIRATDECEATSETEISMTTTTRKSHSHNHTTNNCVGIIPDVLLNELNEILSSCEQAHSDGDENEDEEEDGESSNSSDSSDSQSPVLEMLETIPEQEEEDEEEDEEDEDYEEEEEEWDSDSTLTELTSGTGSGGRGAGHAHTIQLSDVSTQGESPPPPPAYHPLLPLPEVKVTQPEPELSSLPGPIAEKRDYSSSPNEGSHNNGNHLPSSTNDPEGPYHKEEVVGSPGSPHPQDKPNEQKKGGESEAEKVCESVHLLSPTVESSLDKSKNVSPTINTEICQEKVVVSISPKLKNGCVVTPTKKAVSPCICREKSGGGRVGGRKFESPKDKDEEGGFVPPLAVAEVTATSPPSPSSSSSSLISNSSYSSEYFVIRLLAAEQQKQLDLIGLSLSSNPVTSANANNANGWEGGLELSKFIEASTAGSYFSDENDDNNNINHNSQRPNEVTLSTTDMHTRLSSSCSEHQHFPPVLSRDKPKPVLKRPGAAVKRSGRNVSFNESLNLFYEAECQCWIHEEDYARLRHEEQMQQQMLYEQSFHHFHQHHHHLPFDPSTLEFEDTPTLSPPEGYKDRFFPQMEQALHLNQLSSQDPDVTRVSPPSPPAARRKVFLTENLTEQQQLQLQQAQGQAILVTNYNHQSTTVNGLEDGEDEEEKAKKGSRFGGILKGGRLWRSNSSDSSKKISSPEEPDLVKCTEKGERIVDGGDVSPVPNNAINSNEQQDGKSADAGEPVIPQPPTKVSIGTTPLRTSEQIRMAVDSTLRISRSKKNSTKQECSSLVEKLRWLTSLDDEDSSDGQSGFATWPARDKTGLIPNSSTSSSSSRKSDAGTSTSDEFVHPNVAMRGPMTSINEAKIKQISYTLEDIDEGLKGGENELESFITEDGGRMERIRRRYGEDVGGDDYGFSRRPSVKGIKPKFSSTNQIFAQFTRPGAETPIPQMQHECQYENSRLPNNPLYEPLPPGMVMPPGGGGGEGNGGARVNLNYDQFPPNNPQQQQPQNNNSANNPSANGGGNNGAPQQPQQSTPRTGLSTEESRNHFEMIRQSFEQGNFVNFNRPHSWSVSTLPHNHNHTHSHSNHGQPLQQQQQASMPGHIPLPGMTGNLSGSVLNMQTSQMPQQQQGQPQQHPQNNLSHNNGTGGGAGGPAGRPNCMPIMGHQQPGQLMYRGMPPQQMMGPVDQMSGYGTTTRRVPNVIGRPMFLHYGALSVEAHPNKLVQPYPPTKVPETPSPTQPQQPPVVMNNIKYYGPPIRYYNPPPPVPPRSATTVIGGVNPGASSADCIGLERGNPEGATDEEPSLKEPYAMNV